MGAVIVRTFTPLRVGKSNLAVLILAKSQHWRSRITINQSANTALGASPLSALGEAVGD